MGLTLDPEIAAAIATLGPDVSGLPEGAWRERRELFDAVAATTRVGQLPQEDVRVESAQIESRDDSAVNVRIYSARHRSGAIAVYLHGGGHFCSNVDAYDSTCQRYASESGVTIVSVDFRFAPEYPYPCAIEDAYDGLLWTAAHAEALGCDARRLAVMGDSAGGGMAAGLALLARDRAGPIISQQVLIYPMLDDRTGSPDPEIEPFLTWGYSDNVTGWWCLLGETFRTDAVESYAAPARAATLSDLPPAYIEVGQLDLFRDEDVAYGTRLSHAGVPVELILRPGVPHDFEGMAPHSSVTLRAFADRARVLGSV